MNKNKKLKSLKATQWYHIGLFVFLMLHVFFAVGCGEHFSPAADPEHAPDPSQRGPYSVGVTTLRLADNSRKNKQGKPRPMVIEIWYPAQAPKSDAKRDTYDVVKDARPDLFAGLKQKPQVETLTQDAYRDSKILRSKGPYPVILYSHGSGGIRYQSVFQTTHLASHGYIVVAVDHEDNTLYNILAGADARDQAVLLQSTKDRPKDMLFILNELKKRNLDKNDRFYQTIQPQNIGVTGHSFGGFTSLLTPKTIPEIKVSIPQAPLTSLLPLFGIKEKHLASVPIMLMASKNDLTLSYDKEAAPFYKKMLTPGYFKADRYFLTIKKGGHFTFSDLCALQPGKYAKQFGFKSAESLVNDGCSPTRNIPSKAAHVLINRYATALFNVILRKSEGSRKYLSKEENETISFVFKRK